jgi:hypothetical protein
LMKLRGDRRAIRRCPDQIRLSDVFARALTHVTGEPLRH